MYIQFNCFYYVNNSLKAGGGQMAAARFRVDQPSPCSRLPPLRAARPEVRGPSKSGLL